MMDTNELALHLHTRLGGKISTALRGEVTPETLKQFYTPGVGYVSTKVAAGEIRLNDVSWRKRLVAVVSDGSAVLGLGNIGPEAAMPVMEGKAMLFKHFADVDAVPIVLDVHSADEIVAAVSAIAPSFGGINLEDIAAPVCFEVEERLRATLQIPVMHDDQHGTAIVVLAGLINAAKVVGKEIRHLKIVIVGAGAAGVAIAKLITNYAKPEITAVDSRGIIDTSRKDLTEEKRYLASLTSMKHKGGTLRDAITGADVVIGVSRGNMLNGEDIAVMAQSPIIFALANPVPEIMPDVAKAAGAAVVATGRSDFPNQINNVLAFPGIFKGAFDNNVKTITEKHKIAAAEAIASLVSLPTAEKIIPGVFDDAVMPAVARAITP
jgi:malate dehydrogenase (oxaloacetate-decarboxylating)